jgi:hypothetical protein
VVVEKVQDPFLVGLAFWVGGVKGVEYLIEVTAYYGSTGGSVGQSRGSDGCEGSYDR